MTPSARLQAAIEIIDEVLSARTPADRALAAYVKRARFAGSKDRRAIGDLVFDLFRHFGRLSAVTGYETPSARQLAIAYLTAQGDDPATLFNGTGYGAASLSDDEAAFAAGLGALPDHGTEWPVWMEDDRPGDDKNTLIAALSASAPVDLLINPHLKTRPEALEILRENGLESIPTPFSPVGLRLPGRVAHGRIAELLGNAATPQDEGAQLAALAVAPLPGMRVLDYCAGAGGKSLTIAAASQPARIALTDIAAQRLGEARRRFAEWDVGAAEIEFAVLPQEAANLAQEGFERVLLDVPCSGSGTWRRAPDLKARMGPADVAALRLKQTSILREGAAYVAPGGRLIYVTCSLLRSENEAQIEGFLSEQPEFRPIDAASLLRDQGVDLPSDTRQGPYLSLRPDLHGTDAFFIAVMAHRA